MTDHTSADIPLVYRRIILRDGVTEGAIYRVAQAEGWGPPEAHAEQRAEDGEVTKFAEIGWRSGDRVAIYSLVWEDIP